MMKAAFISLALSVCLVAAPRAARGQTDCYFQETSSELILGNSKVEVRFDKVYGTVISLKNKETGTDFIDGNKRASSWFLRCCIETSKWESNHSMANPLTKGWEKPLSGWEYQYYPESDCGKLKLYHTFFLEPQLSPYEPQCTVTRRVNIFGGSPYTRWRIGIVNPFGTGKTVSVAALPHLRGLRVLGGDDYLIAPHNRGERWEDFYFEVESPWGKVHIVSENYPAAPWQWLWYGNPREGLYMASYDENSLAKNLRYGYDDRDEWMEGERGRDEEMAVVYFPFLEPGGEWWSPVTEVGLKSGPGWYWGADRYREEFIGNVAAWEREYPQWLKEAHGLPGTTVYNFSQYPQQFTQQWHPMGEYSVIDSTWYETDYSQYYFPRFYPDDGKGGYEALAAGMGGLDPRDHVLFFNNIYLADQTGDWYAQNGYGTIINQYGQKVEVYFGDIPNKKFWGQCPCYDALRTTLIGDQLALKNAGLDGVWLDCTLVISLFREPFCYDPGHGHACPASAVGPGTAELMRQLNDQVWRQPGGGAEGAICIEGVNDFLIPYVDCWGMLPVDGYQGLAPGVGGERDYPEVARYLLPGTFFCLNREIVPGQPLGYEAHPEISFVLGCKMNGLYGDFDRDLYYGAYDKAPGCFYYGTFKADLGLSASPAGDLKAFSFVSQNKNAVVVTLWNRASVQRTITVSLDLAALGAAGTVSGASDLMDRPLYWTSGATFISVVPADDVTAVKLGLAADPTPTPTRTRTPTPTQTPTLTPVPSSTPTPHPTGTPTRTLTPTLTPTITRTPTPSPSDARKLVMMKRDGENEADLNLYYYNCPSIGDMKYSDAQRSNPSALARDLWIIPRGNASLGLSAIELTGDVEDELLVLAGEGAGDVNLYLFNSLVPGDWTYWDAHARNPSPLARDLWRVTAGNDAAGIAVIDIDGGGDEVAIMKKEGEGDINLYVYRACRPGDWTYWDALARNPSPLARDLWTIPSGNEAIGFAALDVDSDGRKELAVLKMEGQNDVNLYLYNAPMPGDWTYWDTLARNPSPRARDLWIIPGGNDFKGMAAVDMDLSALDELAVLRMENVKDMNLYLYNSPLPGDWTYWDAASRNPAPLARDLWIIPSGNSATGLTAVRLD